MPQPAHAATEAVVSQRGRTWILLGMLIAILGIGVSAYSTWHHMEVHASGQTDAACNINAKFSCDEVALSQYSEVLGTPLGVLGIGYFAACLLLLALGLKGGKVAREHLHAYVAMVLIGVVVSVGLGGISIFTLGSYCLTCIVIYVLTLLQAGLLFGFKSEIPAGFTPKNLLSGGTTAMIAVVVIIASYSWLFKPTPTPATDSAFKNTEGGTEDNPSTPSTLASTALDIPIARSAYAGLGEDYRKGSDTAPVVIVEFADFQCPACAHMSRVLDQLQQEYGDRVQLVYRNYPLDSSCNPAIQGRMHEYACKAAVMARCAGQYGKFWPYAQLVFSKQSAINEQSLKDWAKQSGLTDEQINACWTSPDLLAKVKDDIELGNKLGVDATPTVFINGRKVLGGKGIQDLRREIDQLLN